MATKRNRAWFFTTSGDSQIAGFWTRLVGGGISKPTQATFEDLLESAAVFDEASSAASVDSAAALKDKQGLVIIQTDAKVKTNDNSVVGSSGTAVVRPSQVPTVIDSKLNGSNADVDGTDAAIGGSTLATLTAAGFDATANSSLKVTADSSVTTRNKYFVRASNYFLNFLAGVVARLLPSSGSTNQVLRKVNGTDYNVAWSPSVLPDVSTFGNIRMKTISIGDWNMDSTASVTIASGIVSFSTIVSISVTIINDAGTTMYPLDVGVSAADTARQGYVESFALGGNVVIRRLTGGFFDAAGFSAVSPTITTRGWITVVYSL